MNYCLGYKYIGMLIILCLLQEGNFMGSLVTEKTAYGSDLGRQIISEAGVSIRDPQYSVTENKEERIKNYIATVSQFRKQEGIFPEMKNHIQCQRISTGEDFIAMRQDLLRIKKEYNQKLVYYKELAETDLLRSIKILEAFHLVILEEMIYKIYKSNDTKSNKITLQMCNLDTETLQKHFPLTGPKWKSDSGSSFKGEELPQDVVETIKKKVLEGHLIKMNEILHKIGSFKRVFQRFGVYQIANNIALKIQNNIFKTVDYMYIQDVMNEKALREFYQTGNVMEIAAYVMVRNYDFEHKIQVYSTHTFPSNTGIPRDWNFSHYRSFFKVLQDRELRYFKYLSLQEFLKVKFFDSSVVSSLENDVLFHTLEEFSPKKKNTPTKEQRTLKYDATFSQVKHELKNLLLQFQDDFSLYPWKEERRRNAFCILEFIKENYNLENILKLKNGQGFKEKMNSMSSSFKFLEELNNIRDYLIKSEVYTWTPKDLKAWSNQEDNNITKYIQGIPIIYTYYQFILSKNEEFLFRLQRVPWQICALEIIKFEIESNITKLKKIIENKIASFHPSVEITWSDTSVDISQSELK
ncbi:hypothetical protein PGT21_022486 [Puccinia graminis f. sp. tritici]|uniref:Uncharacterized protein n=1 Tax=Puccinia graminis f. sp. tritici TaxID=56615 RepID=A0A5B0R2V9_PUCGR|nr:hypothetical protein PGT21_022486 [Puccinia graminis f. sp. tritici]